MTNIFLFDYELRLKTWADLRSNIRDLDISQQCVEIDRFWQRAPIVNHYLHTDYIHDWPDPWQLLADNNFCHYARALGMIYTFLIMGTKKVELVLAKDDNSNEVVLVLVDDAKYVLNYWPETVVNNHINDFAIIKTFDISPLIAKIG